MSDTVRAGDLSEANVGERFEIVKGAHKFDVSAEGFTFELVSFGKHGDDEAMVEADNWIPNYPDFDCVDNNTILRRLS